MPDYARYIRTNLTSFLSVRAIVSMLHITLDNRICAGESHDFPELLYVNSGQHTLLLDGQPHTLEPGQLIFYAPHAHHAGFLPSNAVLGIISFEAELPELFPFYNRAITLTGGQQKILSQIISDGVKTFRSAPENSGLQGMLPRVGIADYTLQQLKNRLELFLIDLYQSAEPRQPCSIAANQENHRSEEFSRVEDYLSRHLSENLTLAQISESCAMSIPKLKLLFQSQCGCGPISFFISMKIDAAKIRLCDTSLSITQIAEQLGFHSVHYFSRQFKEKTGMSPSEYAKSLNK